VSTHSKGGQSHISVSGSRSGSKVRSVCIKFKEKMKIRNPVFENFLVLVYPITFLFQIWGSDSWSNSVNYRCNRISEVFSLMQWHSKSSKLLLLLKIKRDSGSERAQNPAQIDSGSMATPGTYLQVFVVCSATHTKTNWCLILHGA